MARKKKTAEKVEEKVEKKQKRTSRRSAAIAEKIEKRPAVSVDAMVDENKAATVSTPYQKYLRKLMKQAGGKH